MFPLLAFLSLFSVTDAKPSSLSNRCEGTISSLNDVRAAVQCTTVNIQSFTVPAGQTFTLDLLQGTTVNVLGDIGFGNLSWAGPLFVVKGQDITFNGNGHRWDGGGPFYWDGRGSSGGTAKPTPMMTVMMSGTLSNVYVLNSPQQAFAVDGYNSEQLTISGVTVDDSQGNYPNAKSGGRPAGQNTDGFDVCANNITIKQCSVINQDDCLAVNMGSNIVFEDNYCDSGHGISIGSINSNAVVDGVVIRGNKVVNSVQAFRIKTDQVATNSQVNNVNYSGNYASNITEYGVLITQSYPSNLGTPGTGVKISNIHFGPDKTEISVGSNACPVTVNCGSGSCIGNWDWSALKTSGGGGNQAKNIPSISGYSV